MSSRLARLAANLAALATASAVQAQTKVIYVDDDAPAGGDGSSWAQALNDLSEALSLATTVNNYQVEVQVAEGIYTPDSASGDQSLSFEIRSKAPTSAIVMTVPGGFSLLGGFRGLSGGGSPDDRDPSRYVTVLSGDLAEDDGPGFINRGDNSDRVLDVTSLDSVTVDGFTIRGAHAAQGVAAVTVGSVPIEGQVPTPLITFSRCLFVDNLGGEAVLFSTKDWAGIQTRLLIADCGFAANKFYDRGFNSDLGTVVIGTLTTADIVRTRFVANQSLYGVGGVVGLTSWPMNIQDCVFAGNSTVAGYASALWLPGDRNHVTRCTIVANRAESPMTPAVATRENFFTDCIFQPYPGASVRTQVQFHTCCGKFTLEHCAIAGGMDAFANNPSSVRYLSGNISSNPQFIDLDGQDNDINTWGDNDVRLAQTSPCIDAGRAIASPAGVTDLWGAPRLVDGNGDSLVRLDMGAHEYGIAPCPSDFDHSGFVDTDDFDAFIQAFEAGC
ncbi:MAG: hypothetical protein L6Q35_15455 [Phycisphaerales bacterium]|nr:hypothetical protein [Phycisphaerales bacterium]